MQIAEGPTQAVLILRNENENENENDVNMIGHQAIRPDLRVSPPGCVGEKIEMERIVTLLEKVRSRRFPRCVIWCGMPGKRTGEAEPCDRR